VFRTFFSDDFTLTKRHLGVILLVAGLVLLLAMVGVDAVSSRPGGFGTIQKLGILVGTLSAIVGLTLLPLGNRPA